MLNGIDANFQYPRCWIVSSDSLGILPKRCPRRSFSILAVGSFPQTLLPLFYNRLGSPPFSILAVGSFPQTWLGRTSAFLEIDFQYPRCWIVSSDVFAHTVFSHRKETFSILAVGSFPQTDSNPTVRLLYLLPFSILAVGSFPQTIFHTFISYLIPDLSVSSLLDRFLRLKMIVS